MNVEARSQWEARETEAINLTNNRKMAENRNSTENNSSDPDKISTN